jgi:hypothetical protein
MSLKDIYWIAYKTSFIYFYFFFFWIVFSSIWYNRKHKLTEYVLYGQRKLSLIELNFFLFFSLS